MPSYNADIVETERKIDETWRLNQQPHEKNARSFARALERLMHTIGLRVPYDSDADIYKDHYASEVKKRELVNERSFFTSTDDQPTRNPPTVDIDADARSSQAADPIEEITLYRDTLNNESGMSSFMTYTGTHPSKEELKPQGIIQSQDMMGTVNQQELKKVQ